MTEQVMVAGETTKPSSRVMQEDSAAKDEALQDNFLCLTTMGRYSNRPETCILNYRKADGRFILVAHDCDQLFKPDWYLNVKEEPIVEIEVDGKQFSAKATTPTGTQRLAYWQIANDLTEDDTLLRIPRQTAVVILDPFI